MNVVIASPSEALHTCKAAAYPATQSNGVWLLMHTFMMEGSKTPVCACMLTLTYLDCSLLNSNLCSAQHAPLSTEQQLGLQSKRRLAPTTDTPALGPAPPRTPLHLPIITIPILITLSDFIGALAAGEPCCCVLDVLLSSAGAVLHPVNWHIDKVFVCGRM